jgi:hypothetical protein
MESTLRKAKLNSSPYRDGKTPPRHTRQECRRPQYEPEPRQSHRSLADKAVSWHARKAIRTKRRRAAWRERVAIKRCGRQSCGACRRTTGLPRRLPS